MKNFTLDSQHSGHVSSSLVKYMLGLDELAGVGGGGGRKKGRARNCNLILWSYGSRNTYKTEEQLVIGEEN
jgi:hypothetical protein